MHRLKKLLVNTIQSVLKGYGFEKDGSVWFKESDGVLSMVALMQEPYGFQKFDLQIGLHVRSLAKTNATLSKRGVPPPAIGAWHLIGNLDWKNPELRKALNCEIEISDSARREAVIEVLNHKAIPILTDFGSKDGISKYIPKESGMFVSASLRDWVQV